MTARAQISSAGYHSEEISFLRKETVIRWKAI